MALKNKPGKEEAVASPDPWDPLIRISHWVVALAVVLNGLLTKPGGTVHVWIGWAVLAVLAIRLIWGVIGPEEARFSAFPPDPRAAVSHLFDLLRGRPGTYASHNPAGAIMVYALWGCLLLVTVSGVVMTGARSPITIAQENAAVAAGDWSVLVNENEENEQGDMGEVVKEVHEVAANLLLILALIHVAGVAMESRVLKRNLVRPMIIGRGKNG